LTGNSCWGTFTIEDALDDMLLFPTDVCDMNDNILPYDIRFIDRYVCLGDTMYIGIANFQSPSHETIPPNQLFTPDRLVLQNGQLIDYDDYGFYVVWDQLGRKEVLFRTTSGAVCTSELSIDVIVMDVSSIPIISENEQSQPIIACVYENISLLAGTSLAVEVKWQLSDGRVYTNKEINISFDEPGTYIVELDENTECSCGSPSFKTIIIEDGESPQIECTGTTCAGEEVTYYSSSFCDQYEWEISPEGTIIEGGGLGDNYITIVWNTSPEGNVTLSTPGCFVNACQESVSVSIPIIDNNVEIEGNQLVCYGETIEYSVPTFDGTNYTWSMFSFYGTIISGQGTNSIVVRWKSRTTEDGPTGVSVVYENCFIDCQGSDTHEVEILPPMDVDYTAGTKCKDASLVVNTRYSIAADWEVVAPDNTTEVYTSLEKLDIILSQVGNYKVLLAAPSWTTCNDTYQFEVFVSPAPSPPANIQESQQVCEGANIDYSIPDAGPFDIIYWVVFDGDLGLSAFSSHSKVLNYEWQSSGPYQIHVTIENSQTGCISEVTTLDLENNSEIFGTVDICKGLVGTYFISTPENTSTNWSISPVNGGSIIRHTSDSLYVFWNVPGAYEVHADVCGISASIVTNVIPEIDLGLNATPRCPDEIFELTGTIPIGVTVEVFDDLEDLVGTSLPLSLDEGFYTVYAINDAGCEYQKEVEITILDVPKVRVSSPQPNVYCQSIPFPITIVEDSDGTFTFEWFRNNVSLNSFGTSISTTDFGMYHVIVTDSNGCTSKSNIHTIREDCGTGSPINFSWINLDCNNLVFEVDPPYTSTNFTWFFDDPDSGPNNVVSGLSVTHEFTYAGYYYVIVNGNSNEAGAEIVEIGTVADFEFADGCAGTPISFTNRSTYIPGFDNSDNLWDFGDLGSGGDNISTVFSPTHVYNSPGNYLVTLQTVDVNGCISTSEKMITIFDNPNIEILSKDFICRDLEALFEASVYFDDYDYSWDFGDTASGLGNVSYDYSTSHVFTVVGIYAVELKVRGTNGCIFSMVKQVEVVDNDLTEDIVGDVSLPKCPEDVITLTAPSATEYRWSNGATSSSISVIENGCYTVTITNNAGCTYSPPSFDVYSIDLYSTVIFGKKRQSGFGSTQAFYDSLVVCEGEEFDLFTNEIPNVAYLWSTSETGTKLFFENHFASLVVGSYDYTLQVTELVSGCTVLHDYRIIINPAPLSPVISTDQSGNCEGILHTISVTAPDPNLLYRWQDGRIGTSIQTRSAGTYYVEAVNNQGCNAKSNPVVISTRPSEIGWMTGCREVCFPNEFCLTLSNLYTYSLYKDGAFLSTISSSDSDLEIGGPGDYSLVVVSLDGCEVETGNLTLSALDNDQDISGIVYYDENSNGVFDGNDVLLDNVTVNLMAGNTVLETVITDASGMYSFSEFEGANHQIMIDVSSLSYTFEGITDLQFSFDNCIDTKQLDFPLVSDCFIAITRIDSLVCSASFITIDGIDYYAGDTDTLKYNINENCDSLVVIDVAEPLEPLVVSLLTSSCMDIETGEIEISVLQGVNLRFSIDESTDTTNLLIIGGLAAGQHILYIHNEIGCSYQYPFEIEEIQAPEIELDIQQSCENEAIGSVTTLVISGSDLTFCIDGLGLSQQNVFTDLPAGDYTITVKDNIGCEYFFPFEIENFPQPDFSVSQQDACDGQSNGTIEITIVVGSDMMFSLNSQSDWTADLNYSLLDPGNYVLYSQSEYGCIESMELTISSISQPAITIDISPACENLQGGSIDISTLTENVFYSLDGVSFSPVSLISDLAPGNHILYYQTEEWCIYEIGFEIIESPAPIVNIEPTPTCLQGDNGEIDISVISGMNLQFSLDGSTFVNDLQFEGLSTGEDTLYVTNEAGCNYLFPFIVPNLPAPELEINTKKTCKNIYDGSININVILGSQLQFSIDDQNYGPDITYTELQGGEYNLFVLDSLGCLYEYPFVIEEFDSPELAIDIINACDSDFSGSLSIESLNSVSAQFAIDTQIVWLTSMTFNDLEIGEHTLYSLSEFGCVDSLVFNIAETIEPVIDIVASPECESNESGTIQINSDIPGIVYSLDGLEFTEDPVFGDLSSGVYTLFFLTDDGCIFEEPFAIELLSAPNIDVVAKPTCVGDVSGSITVVNLENLDLLFSFNGGAFGTESSFEDLDVGQYSIEIQNEVGCIYEQNVSITESPLPIINLQVDDSCEDQDNGVLYIEAEGYNEITINGQIFQENLIEDLMPGSYSVLVKDSVGCMAEETMTIEELPILDVVSPIFDLDCYETEITIIPEIISFSGHIDYQWHNGSTVNQLTSLSSGNHSVTISDECSIVELEWNLNISAQIDESLFIAPNIFSPNNDDVNDCFEIIGNPTININSYKLLIFDRWGNLFFEANDIYDCWDGEYKGKEAVPGVYVYIIEIGILQCEGLSTTRSFGDVTVFR
jgi:gliding motility-associated-like protein